MASNFDFLKSTDRKLFTMIGTAEQLYRDEYFDQCIVQTRKFAESICKKILGTRKGESKTFDDMLATLCDISTGCEQEKEVIEDLYFIKREGNKSAHTSEQRLPASTALECLQRAFEISINYAFAKTPSKTKLLKLEFDTELLITGEKTKKTLKQKYLEARSKYYYDNDNNITEVVSTKSRHKKKNINLTGTLVFCLIIIIYVLCLIFG